MADTTEENTTSEDSEITLDSVDTFDTDNLTDEQQTFLEENKDSLSDEQREKFGIKDEEEEDIDVDNLEPETRSKPAEKKEKDEEEEDEDLDDEDEKVIGKVVDKKLKEVNEKLAKVEQLENEAEVDSVIRSNPLLGKYRGAALKYMQHPAYKNIPAINIMAIVSSKDAQKLGAQKEREISKKVKETQTHGSQARKQGGSGKPDWKNMPSDEFAKERDRIMQNARQ